MCLFVVRSDIYAVKPFSTLVFYIIFSMSHLLSLPMEIRLKILGYLSQTPAGDFYFTTNQDTYSKLPDEHGMRTWLKHMTQKGASRKARQLKFLQLFVGSKFIFVPVWL